MTRRADMAARAVVRGRNVGVITTCHVVYRPTRAEAEAYYHHHAVTMQDTAAVDRHMALKRQHSGSHEPEACRRCRPRFAGGAGTFPLIGTPADVAAGLVAIAEAGFAGTTVSLVDFRDEPPFFIAGVLPLLREAGLPR